MRAVVIEIGEGGPEQWSNAVAYVAQQMHQGHAEGRFGLRDDFGWSIEVSSGTHCRVCQHRVELSDPHDPDSWVHAENGDWADHTAEV